MERPNPNQLLENALRTGKIKITLPYEGYVGRARLRYDVQAHDFTEYFDATTLQNLDENMQGYLRVAQEGVKDFNEHIGNMLGTPELEFHIPKDANGGWTTPRLDGFHIDNGVIVKLLRGKGVRYNYNGQAYFDDIAVPFNFNYQHDVKFRLTRAYEVEKNIKGSDLNTYRFPVILNTNNGQCPQIHKFADLCFYVLLNQLEPLTTDHIVNRLNGFGKKISQQDLDKEVLAVMAEERTVGKILIGNWLESRGIKKDYVKEYITLLGPEFDISAGITKTRVRGIKRLINFYSSEKWSLERLLHSL